MTGREAALTALADVLGDRAYLNLALKKLQLEPREQRFATALVTAVLEHLPTLDRILARYIQPKKTNPTVLNILRLGLAQILYMDGVPDSAAVNESVRLAGRRFPRLRGLVNAVLRKVVREGAEPDWPDPAEGFAEYLAARYDYPLWICALFCEQLGSCEAEKLVSYKGTPGVTHVRRTDRAQNGDRFPDMFAGIYLDDAFRIRHAEDLAHAPLLLDGSYTVQSESSMMCVRALGLEPDACVLDLCAAPGGKSAYAAQIAHSGSVIACDVHPHRVKLIRGTAHRLGCTNLEAVQWDATTENPNWAAAFDAVLVDAPCSALGLAYRKPDLLRAKHPSDLEELVRTQRKILSCAWRYVRPGGVLVYSTCTIDRLENEEVADWFVENFDVFTPGGLAENLPGPFQDRAASGRLQLFPPRDNIDGFFISRFERSSKEMQQ